MGRRLVMWFPFRGWRSREHSPLDSLGLNYWGISEFLDDPKRVGSQGRCSSQRSKLLGFFTNRIDRSVPINIFDLD